MSSPLIICPHCHTPVDPAAMDAARSPLGEWRICPACDEPVLFETAPKALAGADQTVPALPIEA